MFYFTCNHGLTWRLTLDTFTRLLTLIKSPVGIFIYRSLKLVCWDMRQNINTKSRLRLFYSMRLIPRAWYSYWVLTFYCTKFYPFYLTFVTKPTGLWPNVIWLTFELESFYYTAFLFIQRTWKYRNNFIAFICSVTVCKKLCCLLLLLQLPRFPISRL